jgi:hypothetical protein
MSASTGKIGLFSTTTLITAGTTCPTANVIDFIGYGPTANCFEGAPGAVLSNTTAALRLTGGCADVQANNLDFSVGAPAPQNSATAAAVCDCVARNESNVAAEADFCNVQFPTSLSVTTGMTSTTVFGRLFEAGVTEAAGPNAIVRGQLGFGLPTQNPQYQGFTWTNAGFNVQAGNDDEYQASFVAPAPGSYRYAYRLSVDNGVSWTVCDTNGAGSNGGQDFSFDSLPVLTVTP